MSNEPEAPQLSPEERLAAARAAFQNAQRFLPPGLGPIVEPPQMELMATVNALAGLLHEKGVIGEREMVDAKTIAWAELVEQLVDVVGEMKRQALSASIVQAPGRAV